ncbi:ABC-2 transporter permease [Staphylococcus auricularis]|uniref:ABC-2 transporter permease n=1 Tax=Staphylococcus auricularis TaxID=29379 RepID=UPI00242D1839|nr:ABC-2 transporter permease [Staphylococcus auricularis]
MKGLVIKDIVSLFKNFKNIYILIALILILVLSFTVFKDEYLLINILMLFVFINFISNLFVEDNNSGWLTFIKLNSDIRTPTLVISRYLSAITFTITINLLFLILLIIYNLIYHDQTFKNIMIIIATTLIVSLIYIILVIPFIYLFYQNGVIVLILFLAITTLTAKNFMNMDAFNNLFQLNNLLLLLICILLVTLLFVLSFFLSVVILKSKYKDL